MDRDEIVEELETVAGDVEREFKLARRLLSFSEYLELFATDPPRYSRDAAHYMRDMFDHYGRSTVEHPWGELTRFSLFDLPWETDGPASRGALVGQEHVQMEIYRALENFVRQGRTNRLLLMHGPNGSAKTTVASCLMAALEHYSSLDEGALYRFHWVFPNKNVIKGAIGFSDRRGSDGSRDASYAHLPDPEVDARLYVEIRDHPLFVIPNAQREKLLSHLYANAETAPTDFIVNGRLSHKNRQIFEALLASYDGALQEVLRHVQVERYYISRRYRCGAVTIGPQLSVDAGERQVTADRSLASLPSALQSMTLFEAYGELVDSVGGLLEFSDLLKRPLDAFKYLQISVETGQVGLRSQNIDLNCVMVASANEGQLAAFREHPEFESFRGRLELIRTAYLLSWVDEKAIYDAQIVPQVRCHVAPHATEMAAVFAVLTRLRRPQGESYERPLRDIVSELSALEKLDLYGTGATPEHLDDDDRNLLKASIGLVYEETGSYPIYEGSVGASPREMRGVLLDAAQDPAYRCLSPFSVLDQLDALCKRESEYVWLQEERQPGGYHDHAAFRKALRERLLDATEDEFRMASGLVDEVRYRELFDRYVSHVSYWVKGEKVVNPHTGAAEDPDEHLMSEVEALLGSPEKPEEFRRSIISTIAAWAIDHPNEAIDNARVFSTLIKRLRDAVFGERRVLIARLARDLIVLLRDEGRGLDAARRAEVQGMFDRLCAQFGYADSSVVDAAAVLVRERFAELLS